MHVVVKPEIGSFSCVWQDWYVLLLSIFSLAPAGSLYPDDLPYLEKNQPKNSQVWMKTMVDAIKTGDMSLVILSAKIEQAVWI